MKENNNVARDQRNANYSGYFVVAQVYVAHAWYNNVVEQFKNCSGNNLVKTCEIFPCDTSLIP